MSQLRENLRTSLWFLPGLFAVAAAALAFGLVTLDRNLATGADAPIISVSGTADGVRSLLSTIAQSMLTFTGLVFTITMLVLQLASGQLSPRVMRTFLRDRGNQTVLGLFVATFVYTLLVLREVRSPTNGGDGFVPGVATWAAFALLLASVAAFIYYIDHMAHSIRASTVLASIWRETTDAIDRVMPDRITSDDSRDDGVPVIAEPGHLIVKAGRAGSVAAIDEGRLIAAAAHGDRFVDLQASIGEFIPEGAPLARLAGDWDRESAGEIRKAIVLRQERTLKADPAFGFRQLVDIALRALSPGVNDPTTAAQALDRIHDLLRRLGTRRLVSPLKVRDGRACAIVPRLGWDDFVRLGLDEIRLASENQLQITRQLRRILSDLVSVAPEHRQAILRRELSLLDATIDRSFPDLDDRRRARDMGGVADTDGQAERTSVSSR